MPVFVLRCNFLPALMLLIGLTYFSGAAATQAEEEAETGNPRGIALDAEAQQLLGLQTVELQAARYQPEFVAYGSVQDLQPLLELRNRYLAALAAQDISSAHLQQAQTDLARLNRLYREDIVAQSRLQTQQAQWQANRAQAGADRYQIDAIRDSAELQWGKKLTNWVLSDSFKQTLTPQYKLLLVVLPPDRRLPEQLERIRIARSGVRTQAATADFVSPAPQAGNAVQGESYFFACNDASLRAGMRITAWIPEQQSVIDGVEIPASAVVWHLGQAFVYVRNGDAHFERRAIDTDLPGGAGFFVRQQLAVGETLVTTGAQMLLSEEFRSQIPNEDDD